MREVSERSFAGRPWPVSALRGSWPAVPAPSRRARSVYITERGRERERAVARGKRFQGCVFLLAQGRSYCHLLEVSGLFSKSEGERGFTCRPCSLRLHAEQHQLCAGKHRGTQPKFLSMRAKGARIIAGGCISRRDPPHLAERTPRGPTGAHGPGRVFGVCRTALKPRSSSASRTGAP